MSKVVIVSGATGGIGSAVCKKVSDSDILVPVYRDMDKMKKLQGFLTAQCFITTYDELTAVLENIEVSIDDITDVILVLTAFDIAPIKRIENLCEEDVEEYLHQNLLKNVGMIISVLHFSKAHGYALRIINLDTGAAYRPIEGWSLYSSAKAYMNMWLRSIQEEEKIQVVSMDPGVVDTPMQAVIRASDVKEFSQVEEFIAYKKKGKLKKPDDVAEYLIMHYIENWDAEKFAEKYVIK